ncbi:hypothetical protein C8J56DRAFT_933153 [Mycena floridula]|nr:hypothetical protein C8J56DRAFT_933153 [Mycena floridula]
MINGFRATACRLGRYNFTAFRPPKPPIYLEAPAPNSIEAVSGNENLLELVEAGHYSAADRLRVDLLYRGLKIQPRPVYETAALGMLRTYPDDFGRFSTWLSHTPDRHDYPPEIKYRPFNEIRHAVFEAGSPHQKFTVIYHFGLIIASKGYRDIIFDQVFPLLIRFSSPETGIKFLREFEAATLLYEKRVRGPLKLKRLSVHLRERSIMVCSHAGWKEEAKAMLHESRHLQLSLNVYEMVRGLR